MAIVEHPAGTRRPLSSGPLRTEADLPGATAAEAPHLFARRLLLTLGAVLLFAPINLAWTQIVAFPQAGLASVVLVALNLGILVGAWTVHCERSLRKLERALLVLAALSLAVDAATQLWVSQGYGTDEAALQQGAAQALLHGQDPYTANLTSALYGWTDSSLWFTYQLNGHIVNTYGYPALPVLLVTPFVALTHGGQGVSIAYLLVLLGTMALIHRCLPVPFKSLAVVLCAGPGYMLLGALAGETQMLAMLPMIHVAATWSRRLDGARLSRRDALSAGCLGLACSANPTAWFMTPFVLAAILLVTVGRTGWRVAVRRLSRYLAVALLAFAAVNLPFALWSPSGWAGGFAAPILQHAVPLGQGLISLTMFAGIGGGDLTAFTAAGGAAMLALFGVYLLFFRRLGGAGFVLPLLALLLTPRSLAGYWMFSIPVIVVAAACDDRVALRRAPDLAARLRRRIPLGLALAGLASPVLAAMAVALATPAPLQLTVLSSRDGAGSGAAVRLQLAVRNRSGQALRPIFLVSVGDRSTPVWHLLSGPRALAPHARALYTIRAPDGPSAPIEGSTFVVEAETASPETISTSARAIAGGSANAAGVAAQAPSPTAAGALR
jgi:uncharacterized membrane protein